MPYVVRLLPGLAPRRFFAPLGGLRSVVGLAYEPNRVFCCPLRCLVLHRLAQTAVSVRDTILLVQLIGSVHTQPDFAA